MNNKSTQSLVLSKWFSIDSALFGKVDPKSVLSESDYCGYITAKGALLSCLYEIYVKTGYKPNVSFRTLSEMKSHGVKFGNKCNSRAKKLITEAYVAKQVRNEIKNTKLSEGFTSKDLAAQLIDQKIKNITLDVVMLEDALNATGNKHKLREWGGKVLLDAYKTLRDALIKYTY